ncbi:hypothetical protein [Streptosporangium sp. KLBMP 9127]|nr:hypothetical protein [Streptosporangium sp. KLBMP 9127]
MDTTDNRADLITGLINLAVLLKANPDLPAPDYVSVCHYARGTDADIRTEIDRVAALLETEIDPHATIYGHYYASVHLGPVEYTAVGILADARARHDAENSYRDSIVMDPAPTTDSAAHAG